MRSLTRAAFGILIIATLFILVGWVIPFWFSRGQSADNGVYWNIFYVVACLSGTCNSEGRIIKESTVFLAGGEYLAVFTFLCPILNLYQTTKKKLDETKFKIFAGNKMKVAKMRISLFDRVENIVGKGENAGNQHFLLFPQCFPKPCSLGLLKGGIV